MSLAFQRRNLENLALSVDYGVTASANMAPVGPQFLRITDIQDDHVDWSTVPFCQTSRSEEEAARLRNGDIVFARTGATTGKSYLLRSCPERAVFASYLIRVRPDPSQVDPRFLAWYFQSPDYWRQIISSTSGTAQPGVNASKLKCLTVPTPSLPEQRRIADILDKADAIRRKRKQTIALTEELLRSAFLEMFGDPVTNPKGWPKDTLGNLIALKSGNFLSAKEMDMTGPYSVYGGNGINGHHSTFMFDNPVITIGRVGVYCGAVHLTRHQSWVTDNALYVSKFSDALNMTYLEYALRMANLNQYASQAAQPLISGGRIYPVEILVPTTVAQERFERFIQVHSQISDKNANAFLKAENLFGSLVERAFAGTLNA